MHAQALKRHTRMQALRLAASALAAASHWLPFAVFFRPEPSTDLLGRGYDICSEALRVWQLVEHQRDVRAAVCLETIRVLQGQVQGGGLSYCAEAANSYREQLGEARKQLERAQRTLES